MDACLHACILRLWSMRVRSRESSSATTGMHACMHAFVRECTRARVCARTYLCLSLECNHRELTDAFDGNVRKMSADNIKRWMMDQGQWLKGAPFCIFIAAGHGNIQGLGALDGQPVSQTHEIEKPIALALSADGRPKPKFYFYQQCRVANPRGDHTPWADPGPARPGRSDILDESFRFHSTTQDFYSYSVNDDVPFLRSVAQAFKADPRASIEQFERTFVQIFRSQNDHCNQVPTLDATAGMFVCVCVRVCVYVHTYARTHARTHARTCVCARVGRQPGRQVTADHGRSRQAGRQVGR